MGSMIWNLQIGLVIFLNTILFACKGTYSFISIVQVCQSRTITKMNAFRKQLRTRNKENGKTYLPNGLQMEEYYAPFQNIFHIIHFTLFNNLAQADTAVKAKVFFLTFIINSKHVSLIISVLHTVRMTKMPDNMTVPYDGYLE